MVLMRAKSGRFRRVAPEVKRKKSEKKKAQAGNAEKKGTKGRQPATRGSCKLQGSFFPDGNNGAIRAQEEKDIPHRLAFKKVGRGVPMMERIRQTLAARNPALGG